MTGHSIMLALRERMGALSVRVMPFTAAHPAIVLPVLKRLRGPFTTSALVIGTMTPDFEYFLRLQPVAGIGHSPVGLIVFCIPVGLVVLAVFHLVVKRPVAMLLPAWVQARISPALATPRVDARTALITTLLIFAGAITHVVWDGFTHPNGWAVERWRWLATIVLSVGGVHIAVYKLLQHGSTFVGLIALVWVLVNWLWRQPVVNVPPNRFTPGVQLKIVAGLATTAVSTGILWVILSVGIPASSRAFQIAIGRLIVATITGFVIAILIFSLATLHKLRD